MLLRDICVSYSMELFYRTNIKPRNALPVTLDCSQYGGSRFKMYRRCHGSVCRKLLRDLSGVKPPILYSDRAYSLAPARLTLACVYACKAHGSLSLHDDPRMTNSARLQRTV